MEIKTKYDIGQRVYFVDMMNLRVLPVEITCIKAEVFEHLGIPVRCVLCFLSINTWVNEESLYSSPEEAQWQIDGRLQSPLMPNSSWLESDS